MPWPTTDGLRNLKDAEADLVRGAIGMMVDSLVARLQGDLELVDDDSDGYGIEWFDQWDVRQRLWLLDQVTLALISTHTIESPAAIFDATVDAIFHEINDLVQIEIEQGLPSTRQLTWRQSVVGALDSQNHFRCELDSDCEDLDQWRQRITQVADSILGVRLYQRAEQFRDTDYEQTRSFLRGRGLPEDYLDQIPPLRSLDQTQRSIDQIQELVCR